MAQELPKNLKRYGFENHEEVLDTVHDPSSKIEFIRIMFSDILGRPMDFSIPSSELTGAFRDGRGFDGSSVEGFVRVEESDLVIKPDPETFRVLPWEYAGFDNSTSWREGVMFGDIYTPEGNPYEGDSRYVLKNVLKKGKDKFGIDEIKVGPELEFFIFPNNKEARPLDEGGYFFSGRHGEIRKEIQLLLKRIGIESEYDHHEVAHGQHEIDLHYLSAVEMADTCMLFRYMVKKVARMHNLYATFMPKPLNGQNGSGMHLHQSLWNGEMNLFFEKNDTYHLSKMAQHYIAGIMTHSREISAVLCQWTNSYKRLIEGYEAPVYVAWGQRNRSAYIRVPEYQPGKEQAARIELRSPDPACNLYLAFACMFMTGFTGIRQEYELPDPVEENIYVMSRADQRSLNIKTLPQSLEEAVKIMSQSELPRQILGKYIFNTFIANKQREIDEYRSNVSKEYDKQVSEFEVEKYLPFL
ncbi:MAG: glutamine synthetase [Candidatus Aminicenantes bacterium]|nr:MAG: glutamine synthetase [Candidatus Aminicenantes bacterium]